jgi:hypothetical protein
VEITRCTTAAVNRDCGVAHRVQRSVQPLKITVVRHIGRAHYLPQCVDTSIRAARTHRLNLYSEHARYGRVDFTLNGADVPLLGEPMKRSAVVSEVQPQIQLSLLSSEESSEESSSESCAPGSS